jgi:hypothetical protein
MAISSPVFKPIVSTGALNLTILELITVANQATLTLPVNTKGLILRSRVACTLKISETLSGQYITVKPYCIFTLENLETSGKILYIESSIPIITIEVLITHG